MDRVKSQEITSIKSECLLPGFDPADYTEAGKLGEGGQGVVIKCDRKPSATSDAPPSVALKNIQIRRPNGDDTREYKILKTCDHPNVLKLFYWQRVHVPQDNNHLLLYTELCDFNLTSFQAGRHLSIHNVNMYFKQMLVGCAYLHSKKIVHRDLKPENILVNCAGGNLDAVVIKLGDFGLARFVSDDASSTTALGTKRYASPEVTRGFRDRNATVKSKSKFATDIFSLAVVIFEMITKKMPFTLEELAQELFVVENVVNKSHIPAALVKLLVQMLQWNPESRPDAENLLITLEGIMTTPQQALSKQMKAQSLHMGEANGLKIFKLPVLRIHRNINEFFRHYSIGNDQLGLSKSTKVIMMAGMTGAGKSVLINSIANYIYGVSFQDDFRFKLIVEEEGGNSIAASKSRTHRISTYALHYQEGFRVNYTLIIVDIPRLEDGGYQQSGEKIATSLKELFSDDTYPIKEVSSILLVIPASASKFSEEQKYVFDAGENIFGSDVTNNICPMITFADSQKPPAIQALRRAGIPYNDELVCKLPNPVVYAERDPESESSWKSAVEKLENFFKNMEKAEPIRCSEDLTVSFECLLRILKEKISAGLDALEDNKTMTNDVIDAAAAKKKGTWRSNKRDSQVAEHAGTLTVTVRNLQKLLKEYQVQKLVVLEDIQQGSRIARRIYEMPKEKSTLCSFIDMLISEIQKSDDLTAAHRVKILEHFRVNAELLQDAKDVKVLFLAHKMTEHENDVLKAIDLEKGFGGN